MQILHIALGGCLKAPPVEYGLTEDTGGHIAYVLGAAQAQARRPEVVSADILTRAFEEPALGMAYRNPVERVAPGCNIFRLESSQRAYLSKEALEAHLPELADRFVTFLGGRPKPDLIHAHFADAAVLAMAAEQAFGIRWVFTAHSLGREKAMQHLQMGIDQGLSARLQRETRAIERAGAIIASSRDEAERQIPGYIAAAEGYTFRIEPGVAIADNATPDRARRLIAPFLNDTEKPIVLAIARPVEKKNLLSLVDAFAGQPELSARANLVLVAGLRDGLKAGSTEQRGVLLDLFDAVDRHDLWGKVALPRQHCSEDIPSFYALAARGGVFCNPARHEPFGLTLIEAARAGVPIVATRSGGPLDILRDLDTGSLVDPERPAQIADALLSWLDYPQRAAEMARVQRRACQRFDWDKWAARAADVYRTVLTPTVFAPRRQARTMVVCDIDDTLTGCRDSARAFSRWIACKPAGTKFAIATGRPISDARRALHDWTLPEPELFITSVGSEIWRRESDGRLRLWGDYAAWIGEDWQPERIAECATFAGLSAQAPYERRRWKLSYLGSAAEAERLGQALNADGIAARVIASHGRFIDVLPARAGKAAAVQFAASNDGIDPSECVVAGDSGNDADMLAAFQYAIIPANGRSEIDHITTAYRSSRPFAAGVLDGLAHFGIAELGFRGRVAASA